MHRNSAGFTFIEILIVVVITAMISAFAVTYSRSGERQVSLYVEEQKIASFIERARSLAVTVYNQGGAGAGQICGYGMEVDYSKSTYSLFAYELPPAQSSPTACETVSSITPGFINTSAGIIPASLVDVPIDASVQADGTQADSMQYVLFISPDPRTIITSNAGVGNILSEGKVYLSTIDGKSSAAVAVNNVGQVTF